MADQTIDYDALAKQYGATSSNPPPQKTPSTASPPNTGGTIDYDALAKQYGASSSAPPPQPSALARFGNAFYEGSGLSALVDLASGDDERVKRVLTGAAQGIAAEPGRVWGEITKLGQAMIDPKQTTADVAYHMAGAVPLLGAPAQQIAQDVQRGDYAAAGGHATGLVAPMLLGPAGKAASTGATFAKGAVLPAVKAVGRRPPYAALYIGHQLGGAEGAAIAGAIAKAPSVISAGVRGGRAALSARAAAAAEQLAAENAAAATAREAADAALARQTQIYETHERMTQPRSQLPPGPIITPPPADTSFVRAIPGTYPEVTPVPATPPEPLPPSRQLAQGPQVFELPPAADTSFVRAVPAQYPEVIRPQITVPEPPTPALTLEELSKSLTGKSLSKLNQAQRENLQAVYDKIQNPLPVEQPTPAERAIISQPPAQTVSEAGEIPTVTLEYNAPKSEPQPTPDLTQQLQESIDAAQAAKREPIDFEARARGAKVDRLVQVMRENGLSADDASIMDPDHWRMLSKAAGVNEPSGTTARDVIARMRDLEGQEPPPAAAAAPVPESPQQPPAPAGAAAAVPENVQAMLDTVPRVEYKLAKTWGPVDWEALEELAGLPKQTEATRQAVLEGIQARELPASVAKQSPAEAQAAFEKGRANVGDLQSEQWFHGTKKSFDDLDPAFSHPGSEHGEAVYITDRQPEASKYGTVRPVQFTGKVFPEHEPFNRTLLNRVVKRLIADNPKAMQAINEGVARAKALGVKTNDIALQEITRGLPGDFRQRQNALNATLKKLGYSARSYVEETGARTLAVFDKDALRSK